MARNVQFQIACCIDWGDIIIKIFVDEQYVFFLHFINKTFLSYSLLPFKSWCEEVRRNLSSIQLSFYLSGELTL
jgi:hypothetical protein